jgi:hypothetical protein
VSLAEQLSILGQTPVIAQATKDAAVMTANNAAVKVSSDLSSMMAALQKMRAANAS